MVHLFTCLTIATLADGGVGSGSGANGSSHTDILGVGFSGMRRPRGMYTSMSGRRFALLLWWDQVNYNFTHL